MKLSWPTLSLACLFVAFTLSIVEAKIFHPQGQEQEMAQEVWGDLIIQNTKGHPKMILRMPGKDILLSNVHTHWSSCQNGYYLIAKNFHNETVLLDVLDCERELSASNPSQNEDINYLNCPEIYSPVCGLEDHLNTLEMKSFSNVCEMHNDKAHFLYHGSCE